MVMVLMSWEDVCQPKDRAGLSLRKLQDQNTSFIMKLGYKLVTDLKSLRVQILQAKYGVAKGLLDSLSRNRCSFLWRALTKVQLLIRENLRWSVGDGKSVRCWHDPWVPSGGPRVNMIFDHLNLDLDCVLSDMILDNGTWNLELFHSSCLRQQFLRLQGFPHRIQQLVLIELYVEALWQAPFLLKAPMVNLKNCLGNQMRMCCTFLGNFKDPKGLDSSFGLRSSKGC